MFNSLIETINVLSIFFDSPLSFDYAGRSSLLRIVESLLIRPTQQTHRRPANNFHRPSFEKNFHTARLMDLRRHCSAHRLETERGQGARGRYFESLCPKTIRPYC